MRKKWPWLESARYLMGFDRNVSLLGAAECQCPTPKGAIPELKNWIKIVKLKLLAPC